MQPVAKGRDHSDLVHLLATATIFFEGNAADAMEYNDGLGVLLLGNSVMYAVLFISSMINVHSAINADTARWESGDRHVVANSPTGTHHAFISHQWSKGQDQAKTIKQTLRTEQRSVCSRCRRPPQH